MRLAARLGVVLSTIAAGLAALVPSAAAASGAPSAWVTVASDGHVAPRSTDGHSGFFTDRQPNTTITLGGTSAEVTVDVEPAALTFDLQAPSGGSLAAGTYSPATFATSLCADSTSTVTIDDIAFDGGGALTAISLQYETQCASAATTYFGRIVSGEAQADSDLLLAPDAVAWPTTLVRADGAAVPVFVVNTGSNPVSIASTSLTQPADSPFSKVYDDCNGSVLAIASTCTVWLAFDPTVAGQVSASLDFVDDTTAGAHHVPLSATVSSNPSSWALHSAGDPVGAGGEYSFSEPTAQFAATGSAATGVALTAHDLTFGDWSATFTPPSGSLLQAGHTYRTADGAGLAVTGLGSCPQGSSPVGWFTLSSLSINRRTGAVTTAAATFEQHCGTIPAGLFGSLSYNDAAAPASVPPVDTTPPPAVTGLTAQGGLEAVSLRWTNPDVADFDHVDVYVTENTGFYPNPSSVGAAHFTTHAAGLNLQALDPGSSFKFSVYAVDLSGNRSPVATIKMDGTDLMVRTSRTSVLYGDPVNWTFTLTHNGSAQAGKKIDILVRTHGLLHWSYFKTVTTDTRGMYAMTFRPAVNMDVTARFYGDGSHIGDAGNMITTWSAYRIVVLSVAHYTQSSAAYDTVKIKVYPSATTRLAVEDNRYGYWSTIGYVTTDATGSYTWRFRPIKGRVYYRFSRPASGTNAAGVSGIITITGT